MISAQWVAKMALAGALVHLAASAAFAQPGRAKPKAQVSLIADVQSWSPGTSFEVGLRFELDDGWHIYWINSGESGLPPRVEWNLPPGFRAGDLQFPVPKRYVDRANITTFIHEDDPVLLAKVTPPADADAKEIEIAADVTYLICAEMCLREQASLKLSLPATEADEAKPAHADIFAAARDALPAKTSKLVRVTPRVTTSEFSVGTKFDFILEVQIADGFHIQSNKPLTEGLVATDVFLEPVMGVTFGDAQYPKPKFRTIPVLGKISEFEDKITIRMPAEVDEAPADPKVRFAGVLTFQGCDKQGQCRRPSALEFEMFAGKTAGAGDLAQTKLADAEEDRGRNTARTTYADADEPRSGSTSARVTDAAGDAEDNVFAADKDAGENSEAAPADEPADKNDKSVASTGQNGGLEGFLRGLGLPGMLLGCFLYGVVINLTPCVLPLLSIKVLGFVQQAHGSRGRTLALGLAFGAGVVIFFVVLGGLASRGTNILHFPLAVIALGSLVFAMALSMLGVFTLQVPTAATQLDASIQKEGMLASFGKGALAPVLGFACTGPFMAAMFGWATQQPPRIAVIAFIFTGVGMASPYMVLGANPNWLGFLPKPGNWMITFERIMGFLLLAMVPWLMHPLVEQIGPTGFEISMGFLVAIGMACWIWGQIKVSMPTILRWQYRGGAVAIVAVAALLLYGLAYPLDEAMAEQKSQRFAAQGVMAGTDWSKKIPWRPWSPDAVDAELKKGKAVFVDFTAAYCTVCKQNKAIAIDTEQSRQRMADCDMVALQGDFTTGDRDIFAQLQEFERPGVPLNLVYKPNAPDNPIVLPPTISQQLMLETLDEVCANN